MASQHDEAVSLMRSIYKRHSAGCCMHVVLDDQNFEYSCVATCLAFAVENDCAECRRLAEIMSAMTEDERAKARDGWTMLHVEGILNSRK